MKKLLTFCLLSSLLCASSCDITKRLRKQKPSSKVEQSSTPTDSNQSTQLRRIQLNEDWSQIGSSLFHSNGDLWITFDGDASIDTTPDNQIRAIGNNPVIHGAATAIPQDSIKNDKDSPCPNLEETPNKQKIAPLLVIGFLLMMAVIYAASKLKP